jgi:hypothetical protein
MWRELLASLKVCFGLDQPLDAVEQPARGPVRVGDEVLVAGGWGRVWIVSGEQLLIEQPTELSWCDREMIFGRRILA